MEEAKTEADIILQAQAKGAAIRTKMKVQANSKLMDKGMTNPKSNVIIVRNMGTMPMNVEKNKMTSIVGRMLILQMKKIRIQRMCF